MKLRVGTRRSRLALTQSEAAMNEVAAASGITFELTPMLSTGDRIQDRPLREAGGKGLFVRELDDALLAGSVDCAVHSLKDVPTELPDGIVLAAVLRRASPADVLLSRDLDSLEEIPSGARVGTTSPRRASQVAALGCGARIELLRGNVETRLARLRDGELDVTFLARAGLDRLGIDPAPLKAVDLDPSRFVAAAGQGALAITARAGDRAVRDALASAEHAPSRLAVDAERGFAAVFGGGCHLPVGAYAVEGSEGWRLSGLLASPDGAACLRDSEILDPADILAGARRLGLRMLDAGGREILAGLPDAPANPERDRS